MTFSVLLLNFSHSLSFDFCDNLSFIFYPNLIVCILLLYDFLSFVPFWFFFFTIWGLSFVTTWDFEFSQFGVSHNYIFEMSHFQFCHNFLFFKCPNSKFWVLSQFEVLLVLLRLIEFWHIWHICSQRCTDRPTYD